MKQVLAILICGVFAANAYARTYGAAPDAPPPLTKAAYKLAAEKKAAKDAVPKVEQNPKQEKNAPTGKG